MTMITLLETTLTLFNFLRDILRRLAWAFSPWAFLILGIASESTLCLIISVVWQMTITITPKFND